MDLIKKTIREIIWEKGTNVILSADMTNADSILDMVKKMGPKLLGVKLHSDIIDDYSQSFIETLLELSIEHNFLIIEDRKFCDIGNTVRLQSASITKYADLITVHSVSGQGILDGLRENCINNNCGILLIAQMSSKDNLISNEYTQKTIELAKNNSDIVIGFICQEFLASNFVHFTPGVKRSVSCSVSCSSDNLGQQYNSPEHLIVEKRIDCLIVGRGLYLAKDPYSEIDNYIYTAKDHIIDLFKHSGIIKNGNFTLKSGQQTEIYFDFRNTVSYPNLLEIVAKNLYNMISCTKNIVVTGVPTGAIPITTIISGQFKIPMITIREKKKEHGMENIVDGSNYEGKECILVEDVITTGSSVMQTIDKLKNEGIVVKQVIGILNRESGGVTKIKEMGYNINCLLKISDLI